MKEADFYNNPLFEKLPGIEMFDKRCWCCPARAAYFEQIWDRKVYLIELERAIAGHDYLWIRLHSTEFAKITDAVVPDENPFATAAVEQLLVFICHCSGHWQFSLLEFTDDILRRGVFSSVELMEELGHSLEEDSESALDDPYLDTLCESWLYYSITCKTREAKAQVLESLCKRFRFLYTVDMKM